MKLNYLLVMPRLVQEIGDGYVFPLGLAYISSSLKSEGFNVATLNLNHSLHPVDEVIKEYISEYNINIVGTGGLSPQFHLIKSVVDIVKDIDQNIIVVVGGGIISADPETAMVAFGNVDFGVIGEGEKTICELSNAIENDLDISDVDGLIIRNQSKFEITNTRADIDDISLIPWPDYDGFDMDKYLELPPSGFAGLNAQKMIPMLGSRSCPYKCTFCFHSIGKKYRKRSLDDFFSELDYLLSKYDIKYISMADELFLPKFSDAKEFCARMKNYDIKWYADFSINQVKPGLLPVLKDGGCDVIFFGLESADNNILKSMKKGVTIEKTEHVLKEMLGSGVDAYGCFIFGDIEETVESANKTLDWWKQHPEYLIHLTLIKPFPGSYIYDYACRNDIIKDKVKYLYDGCPQVNISKMTDVEFANIANEISSSLDSTAKIDSVKLINLDEIKGRELISGICPTCKNNNVWDAKLFSLDYLSCDSCGLKFHVPVPDELKDNIERNIEVLLEKYKVAIWGMTIPVVQLFSDAKVLEHPHVYPVDISETKRAINVVNKKQVFHPDIIQEKNISCVIIGVPSHIMSITHQIINNYKEKIKIIDICSLVSYKKLIE